MINTDEYFMKMALRQASEAFDAGEVPVGAIAVKDGMILGKGRNRVESLKDPTAHAEMEAITAAASALGNKQLQDVTLYVTLEPCPMCSGALVLAKVGRVVYGVDDPKTGGCGSVYRIHDDPSLNHSFVVNTGVLEQECSYLLKEFFRQKREKNK